MTRAAGLLAALLVSVPGLVLAQGVESPLVRMTAGPGNNLRAAWSPDGKTVAFQSNRNGTYQIATVGVNGTGERGVSRGEADDRHPAWSPDGRQIAFDSGNDKTREIWVMDPDGGGRRRITSLGAFSSFPAFSPDGQKIAFFAYQDGVMDLWMTSIESPAPKPLTSRLADQRDNGCTFACHVAAWSPDGSTLAYSSGDQRKVWTLPLATGTPLLVTSSPDIAHFPWYLPDGRLGYVEEHVSATEAWVDLWAIDPRGGRGKELLLGKVRIQGPFDFSPDGQRLLFHSPRAGNFDIYLADLTAPGAREALQALPVTTSVLEEDETSSRPSASVASTALVSGWALIALEILLYGVIVVGALFSVVRFTQFWRLHRRLTQTNGRQ